jgi:glycosyltransferase involved in cell wall biosynthesis
MIPLFSVIVPLYNKEAYIVETLRSIMNQSCEDFELIVVDDCSTDNSLNLVKSLQIPNIQIICHKTNKGLSTTRNTGTLQAKGELITMIDADDRWHHDFLSVIAKMVVDFPKASIFGTGFNEIYSNGKKIWAKPKLTLSKENSSFMICDFFKNSLGMPLYCMSSVAYKKTALEGVEGFDENIKYSEDIDFFIKINLKYSSAYHCAPLSNVRVGSFGQMTVAKLSHQHLPDLDKYEAENAQNTSFVKYINFKRYMYAMRYRQSGEHGHFYKIRKNTNKQMLTFRQIILLHSPKLIYNFIRFVKKQALCLRIRLTTFD